MEEEIKKITDKIAKEFKPRKLLLFGSRAAGTASTDSDFDLCVIQDRVTDRAAEAVKIRNIIGTNLIPLDILVLAQDEYDRRKNIWGTVQYEINKKGIVLYERRN